MILQTELNFSSIATSIRLNWYHDDKPFEVTTEFAERFHQGMRHHSIDMEHTLVILNAYKLALSMDIENIDEIADFIEGIYLSRKLTPKQRQGFALGWVIGDMKQAEK